MAVRLAGLLFVVGILLVATLPTVGAQTTPAEGVLYFTAHLAADATVPAPGSTTIGAKTFDSTLAAPTAAADQKAYANAATIATSFETAFTWKATQPFTLAGKVTAHFWLSCDVAAAYSGVQASTYRFTFKKNGATIGSAVSGTDPSPVTCNGSSSVREITVAADSKETAWKAGDTITASFAVWATEPPEAAAKNLHFLVNSTKHPSQIHAAGLPASDASAPAPVAGKTVDETLDGARADIDHSFANASSDTYRYNWTTDANALTLTVNTTATNGSLQLVVRAPDGTEAYNRTVTAADSPANETLALTDQSPGAWNITVVAKDASGRVQVALYPTPHPAPSSSGAPSGGSSAATGSDAASPTGSTPSSSSGTPGFQFVPLALALAGLATLGQRRRR